MANDPHDELPPGWPQDDWHGMDFEEPVVTKTEIALYVILGAFVAAVILGVIYFLVTP